MADHTAQLRTIARKARERCNALRLRGTGRRAGAILHYFVGAAAGAEAAGDTALATALERLT